LETILLMVVLFVGYLVAYYTYGRFLARKIFKLRAASTVPSEEFEDGVDYVPTSRGVVFGHHFTSIAGTGPIVGPAIAIIWGWVPAVIWVFVGSIFMGAVHDFGAMVVSLRNQGKSISDIAARYISPRVQVILFGIVFLELLIVIAIFGWVIAQLFEMYPQSVFPVWCEIPIAIFLGWAITKRKWNVVLMSIIAVAAMYVTVIAGHWVWKPMPTIFGLPAAGVWTVILLIYAFIASTLPVTTLLQPRDYINAWQLFIAMALLIVGCVLSGVGGDLAIVAPAFDPDPEALPVYGGGSKGALPFWPFLFVTIACGAISGFHSLVASGTSSKQLKSERDALPVGYGSMLMEGALAVLVIIAVAAGIGMSYETDKLQVGPDGKYVLDAKGNEVAVKRTLEDGTRETAKEVLYGKEAWDRHYRRWGSAKGLGAKVSAFVIGGANMIARLGIPVHMAIIIMGVFVASFAGTTLDTATRLQRYVIGELAARASVPVIGNRWVATGIAVVTAGALALSAGKEATGATELWPMFGALNQVLAALALLIVTIYLKKKGGKKFLFTAIPCVFMLVMTIWAVIHNEVRFIGDRHYVRIILNGLTLVLAVWMVIEVLASLRAKGKANVETEVE